MNIREFFLGTGAEIEASKTSNDLKAKDHLRDREKRRLEEALSLSRRRFLRSGAVVGAGILIGGGAAVHFGFGKDADKNQNRTNENRDLTQAYEELDGEEITRKTDELILKAEHGFANFETLIAPHLRLLPNGAFKDQLQAPFDLMKINKKNPNKNGPRFNREGRLRQDFLVKVDNLNFFSFEARDNPDLVAGFIPTSRTMQLSPHFDPDNFLDMCVFYHELRHAAQDANVRRNFQTEEQLKAYLAFNRKKSPSDKSKVIITEEATAYAFELEILNFLLDGKLRSSVEKGEQFDINWVRQKLNARKDQNELIEMLISFANKYYPEGISTGEFSKRFLDKIAELCRTNGQYEIYIPNSNGKLELY